MMELLNSPAAIANLLAIITAISAIWKGPAIVERRTALWAELREDIRKRKARRAVKVAHEWAREKKRDNAEKAGNSPKLTDEQRASAEILAVDDLRQRAPKIPERDLVEYVNEAFLEGKLF